MTASPSTARPDTDEQEFEGCTIIPPNLELKRRALRPGSRRDVEDMLAEADRQVEELKPEFGQWMLAEVEALRDRLTEYLVGNGDEEARGRLYRALHDIRGNAAAFGHALAGRIADSMCKLFDSAAKVPQDIVVAHVHAIQAAVRENATDPEHPLGVLLIRELQRAAAVLTQPDKEG